HGPCSKLVLACWRVGARLVRRSASTYVHSGRAHRSADSTGLCRRRVPVAAAELAPAFFEAALPGARTPRHSPLQEEASKLAVYAALGLALGIGLGAALAWAWRDDAGGSPVVPVAAASLVGKNSAQPPQVPSGVGVRPVRR